MAIFLPAYDDSIVSDATNAVHAKSERLWMVKIGLQTLIKIVERAGSAFLVAVVKDTWLLTLKEETTFYKKVPLRNFFTRLKGGSGGLEATDIVSILSAILGWWAEDGDNVCGLEAAAAALEAREEVAERHLFIECGLLL